MRLHRLTVRDFKGLTQAELSEGDLEAAAGGVLVVEGRNEAGKSTLLEALDLLLEAKSGSSRQQVKDAQPVGRDVGPFVEAEISSGPYRFVYRKQWVKGRSTELHITAPAVQHLTGDPAHDRVERILAETMDVTLWRALRLVQATPLAATDLSGSATLAAALEAAAGEAAAGGDEHAAASLGGGAGAAGESVLEAAAREDQTYYTAGKRQETGPLRAARERAEAARAAAEQARELVDEVAADVVEFDRFQGLVEDCDRRLPGLREAVGVREAEAEAVERASEHLQAARQAHAQAARDLEQARRAEAERAGLVGEVEERQSAHTRASQRVAQAQEQSAPAASALDEAMAGQERAERARERARTAARRAQDRVAYARDVAVLGELAGRVERLDDAAERRSQARARVQAEVVTPQVVAAVEEAAREVEVARAAYEAGSASVTVQAPEPGADVVLDGTAARVGASAPLRVAVTRERVLQVGEVTVRVRPEAAAGDREAEVRAARERLREALERAAADDVAAARAAAARRAEAVEQERRAVADEAAAVAGGDADELRERLAAVRERVAAHAGADGDAGDAAADTEPAGGVADAEAAEVAARRAWEEAEAQAREAGVVVAACRVVADEQRVALATAQAREQAGVEELEAATRRLGQAREQVPDAELARVRVEAEAGAERTAAVEREQQRAVEALEPELVVERLGAARRALGACERQREEAVTGRIRVQARLDHAGRAGRQEALDEAESEVARAEAEWRAVSRHAAAAQVLHETLRRHADEVRRAYVTPFSREVVRLGRVVFGPGFDVEVDDRLRVVARVLDGVRVPYAGLSTGAKEQLAVVTRLACAALVAGDGVPLVLDDALGYTDPERLSRVSAAFGRAGTQAQVIVLTCTPGRYAEVPGARTVRL